MFAVECICTKALGFEENVSNVIQKWLFDGQTLRECSEIGWREAEREREKWLSLG